MKTTLFAILVVIGLCSNSLFAQTGISSDGREYFIGMPTPSLIDQPTSIRGNNIFRAKLLISSLGENNVTINYYSPSGAEVGGQGVHLMPNGSAIITLDLTQLKTTANGEIPEYKTCHIVAQSPISVQVQSVGAGAGGSYQALPVQCLGRNYVVMSYHDNPTGIGGVLNTAPSAGYAMIIAPYDATTVEITPTSSTAGGHQGYRCGSASLPTQPPTFSVGLNHGQCYYIKSAANDNSCDLSNSTIRSDKPIVVLAGHENAFTDGSDVDGGFEQRDFMIEQLLPVECFDTTGYYIAPLFLGSSVTNGDEIRIFSNGSSPSNVVRTFNGTDATPMPSNPYDTPPTIISNSRPLSLYSTNGKPFSVMLYDQRIQETSFFPSPSMMSIIPRSRWKSNYYWTVQQREGSALYGNYVNLIARSSDFSNSQIKVSINGASPVPINSAMSIKKTWSLLAGTDLVGVTFSVSPGSYRAFSAKSQPFMLYNYGWQVYDPDGDPPEEESFYYSYASPMGMTYAAFGVPKPKLSYTVSDYCDRWKVCVSDSGAASNGIRYIEILNYDNPSFFGIRAKDIALDNTADPLGKGDIILDGTSKDYCFFVQKKTATAHAAIVVYDNSGESLLIGIDNQSIFPVASGSGELKEAATDIYQFASPHIDSQSCGSIIIRSSDSSATTDILINDIILPKDKAFKLTSILPTFPVLLHKSDSIVLDFCFTPTDTLVKTALVQVVSTCPDNFIYTLRGRGTEGLINATDITFSDVKLGSEECKSLSVSNIGSYPFTLTSYSLDNRSSFTLDVGFVAKLPITLQPGTSISADVCFHPLDTGHQSGRINWKTDLIDNTKIKSYSLLNGKSSKPTEGVSETEITTGFKARYESNRLIIDIPTSSSNPKLELFDLLGRAAGHWEYSAPTEKTIAIATPHLVPGVYILRLQAGTMIKSCSVIIK